MSELAQMESDAMSALRPYATVLAEEYDGREVQRLVVVEALSAADARSRSGLVQEKFHLATEEEVETWDKMSDRPLTERDAEALIVLVEKELRKLGKSVERDIRTGRADRRRYRDANRYRARRLNQLVAKLEAIDTDDELDDEIEAESDIEEM